MLNVAQKSKLTREFYTRRKRQLTKDGYSLDRTIAQISNETNCHIGYVWRFYYQHDPLAIKPDKSIKTKFDIRKAADSVLNRGKNQCGYFLSGDTLCTAEKQRGAYCNEHYEICFVSVNIKTQQNFTGKKRPQYKNIVGRSCK